MKSNFIAVLTEKEVIFLIQTTLKNTFNCFCFFFLLLLFLKMFQGKFVFYSFEYIQCILYLYECLGIRRNVKNVLMFLTM